MAAFEIARRLVNGVWRTVQVDEDAGGGGGGGGSQPGAWTFKDFLFEEPDAPTLLPIVAVDLGEQTVTVDGDHTAHFPTGPSDGVGGAPFAITGSTGNDSTYVALGSALVGGQTVVSVNTSYNSLSDATADGSLGQQLAATFPIAAGSTILDVWLYDPTGNAWIDNPNLSVWDSEHAYYDNYSPGISEYLPGDGNVASGGNFASTRTSGSAAYGGANGAAPFYVGATGRNPALGVPYVADDTLNLVIGGLVNAGGGAQTIMRVLYATALTAEVAT